MKAFAVAALILTTAAGPPLARAESVAARVNGTAITEVEVQALSEKMAAAQGADQSPASLRQDALQELISTEILVQQAAREKVEITPAEVEQRLTEMKARYGTAEAFQQMLTALHGTEAELRRDLGRSTVIEKLLARHVSVNLPADAAEKFYKENTDKFQHAPQVRASHILFAVAENADPAAAKQRAEDALEKLRAGEDFAKLARELSDDKESAANGGDLDFFAHDDSPPAFADAAFGLQPGQISDVVQTPIGFHIIKLTAKRDAGVTPLAELKPHLEEFLKEQERGKQEDAYVEQLKKDAKIEITAPTPSGSSASGEDKK